MHPEIEKYWNDLGYEVEPDILVGPGSADSPWRVYWFIMKDDKQLNLIGMSGLQPARNTEAYKQEKDQPILCDIYCLNQKEYTEAEMLTIVRDKI